MSTHHPFAVTTILAIRHGETAWNSDGRYQGQTDVALNAAGREQATWVARALARERIDAVYSSDLARAVQTAQTLATQAGVPLRLAADLREQHFGVFQGRLAPEIEERWPDEHRRWLRREPDFGPPGGETRRDFSERCVGAVHRLAREHPGQTLAIVCHGGVLDCLYRAAHGLSLDLPRKWALDNAGISRLRFDGRGLHIDEWGDTSHLPRENAGRVADLFPAP
jgi:2,3-bisphosphoglycerate-dependent phosphoglycerate mutase